MGSSIAPETWYYVLILKQDFTMKAKAAEEQELIFSIQRLFHAPVNSPVLTLAQIIKFFMSSASEAEMGELFVTAQEMVSMRNTLEEMKWLHPKSPI